VRGVRGAPNDAHAIQDRKGVARRMRAAPDGAHAMQDRKRCRAGRGATPKDAHAIQDRKGVAKGTARWRACDARSERVSWGEGRRANGHACDPRSKGCGTRDRPMGTLRENIKILEDARTVIEKHEKHCKPYKSSNLSANL
jgi:hypothetical protein